ncbi:unnamed protein product [Cuscuta europaea]|uniref:28S ribosomal protein S34, mitochondrial n=1 Tax=Cuscuta europaea TaxID=41803 RepID=A0A9P0YH01_CUSEU|nr:unnamed protein product [Cuscuta europaea]
MASALASKAALGDRMSALFRLSCSSLRYLSTSPKPAVAPDLKKPNLKKKKKKNLFEVVQFLPNWGIGYQLAKTHWTDVSYRITKINLYKSGTHGKAWGIAHKDGSPIAEAPKKISGVNKRCWRYIPNSHKAEECTPKHEVQSA